MMMKIITKSEAKTKQLKLYYTGVPCHNNHLSCRYVSSGRCLQCIANSGPAYYKANANRKIEYAKQYHRDHTKKHREYSAVYRKQNPHKVAEYASRRCSYMKAAEPSWYGEEEHLVKEIYLQGQELSVKWNKKIQVDHIIPILHPLVCGLHCWANLQLLDAPLNRSKSNKLQADW